MSNIKYNTIEVLNIIEQYMTSHPLNDDSYISIEGLYNDIVMYANQVCHNSPMPKFAQARKIIINCLKIHGRIKNDERLTTQVAYRLTDLYYCTDDIEKVLENEYDISIYSDDVIIYTFDINKVVPFLKSFSINMSELKHKTTQYGIINTVQKICNYIKSLDKDVLAVIPEFNRMNYINSDGLINRDMDGLEPVCDNICVFIKSSPSGKKLIKKWIKLISSIEPDNRIPVRTNYFK